MKFFGSFLFRNVKISVARYIIFLFTIDLISFTAYMHLLLLSLATSNQTNIIKFSNCTWTVSIRMCTHPTHSRSWNNIFMLESSRNYTRERKKRSNNKKPILLLYVIFYHFSLLIFFSIFHYSRKIHNTQNIKTRNVVRVGLACKQRKCNFTTT